MHPRTLVRHALAASIIGACFAACEAPHRTNPVFVDPVVSPQTMLDLTVGTPSTISLPAHGGTGYEWVYVRDTMTQPIPVAVQPKGSRAIDPGVAGGPREWGFEIRPVRAGRGTLTFELRRPWEKSEPAAQKVVIPYLVDRE